ncbi:MAG TPA: hypothetical protein DDZ51_21225 [Planctomycetaceae bacterium]|nr:hypothetical protein [Planctomycetaceae bacterium]
MTRLRKRHGARNEGPKPRTPACSGVSMSREGERQRRSMPDLLKRPRVLGAGAPGGIAVSASVATTKNHAFPNSPDDSTRLVRPIRTLAMMGAHHRRRLGKCIGFFTVTENTVMNKSLISWPP